MEKNVLQQRFADWQKANKMPKSLFPPLFKEWVLKAILFHSPAGLKMSVEDYVNIVDREPGELTIWDLGAVFHVLEIRTAAEMNMNLQEYCRYMECINSLVTEWRKRVEPVSKKLSAEYQAELKAEADKKQKEMEAQGVTETEQPNGQVIPLPIGKA